ncbi:AAA family ATPase [Motiliproteus sp. SC1-56]|uniref:AAA family ATPase n=1 Tax=Motiliproteus sp. SC1-56 TaxID=2799565 RepID=UPI001A8F3345|nr:AAA family ATPase [Motiliproteus sp. SC1-56]
MPLQSSQQYKQLTRAHPKNQTVNVLVASRQQQDLDRIMNAAAGIEGLALFPRLICNGHCDPLYGLEQLPDILIFRAGAAWREELEALKNRSPQCVPFILLMPEQDDAQMLRAAMQAGARDFFIEPYETDALLESVNRLIPECLDQGQETTATLTTFINAKGGSGSSLIATNVAHIMAQVSKLNVALVDLDIQFGGLPYYLGLTPKHGILEAVERVEELDEMALNGFFIKCDSGLQVLGSKAEHLEMVADLAPDKLGKLINLIRANRDHLFIDLPRHIDLLATNVLERSDQVVIVVQQNLTSLHDGVRLMGFLKRDLSIEKSRIKVVVNRYQPKSEISLKDMEHALQHSPDITLPNAYKEVSESIQSAKPLYSVSKGAAITKALMKLETHLGGHSMNRPGAIARFVTRLKGA